MSDAQITAPVTEQVTPDRRHDGRPSSHVRQVLVGGCLLLVVVAAAAGGGTVAVRASTDVPATAAPRDPAADVRAAKWPLHELTSARLTQRTITMSLTVPDEPALLDEVRSAIDQATNDYSFVDAAPVTARDGRIVLDVAFGPSVDADLATSIAAAISTRMGEGRVAATTRSAVSMSFEFQAQFVPGSPASLPPGGFSAPTTERVDALIPAGATWAAHVGADLVGLVYRGPVLSTQTLRTLRELVAAEAGMEPIDVSILPAN